MPQVSVGQVENLQDLVRGLLTIREELQSICKEQIELSEKQFTETGDEATNSQSMLHEAIRVEDAAHLVLAEAQQNLEAAESELNSAESALSELGY